jgi:hypothetical protein
MIPLGFGGFSEMNRALNLSGILEFPINATVADFRKYD